VSFLLKSALNFSLGYALFCLSRLRALGYKTCVIRLHFLDESLSSARRPNKRINIYLGVFYFQSAFSEEYNSSVRGATTVHINNSQAYARSLRNKTLFDVLCSTKNTFLPRYI
jgi:hypothetical protein